MAKIISIINQKGGVGKTTTCVQVGAWLKLHKKKVLLIDMDPQCNLSVSFKANLSCPSIYHIICEDNNIFEGIQHLEECDIIVSNPLLSNFDNRINGTNKEDRLKEAIYPILNMYDYIIIDSPPTLGLLTLNVLTASNSIVVPTSADMYGFYGIRDIFNTFRAVKKYKNSDLNIEGILLVRYANRLLLSNNYKDLIVQLAKKINVKVFETSIRDSVIIRESTASGMSVFKYAPRHKITNDYDKFCKELFMGELN